MTKTMMTSHQKQHGKCISHFGLLLLLTIALVLHTPAMADTTLPHQCVAFRPAILNKYIVKEKEIDALMKTGNSKKASAWGQNVNTNTYWVVFSDRSNNVTYQSPEPGSPEFDRLPFGQELIIAQIVNNYALVYVERKKDAIYPEISLNKAVSKGWIPMDHLLLWTDCPANDNFIYNKALIVGNIDIHNDPKIGKLFYHPSEGSGKSLQSTMHFFFQMKRVRIDDRTSMVLLAKESRVGGATNQLYGWVSEGSFTNWDQRTCLEPNWDRNVVNELQGQSIPVINTVTNRELTNIVIGAKKNRLSKLPETEYRLDPEILRYPILDVKGKDYIATVFAKEGAQTNTETMQKVANNEAILSKANEDRSVINIIMVIDGTRSMGKFFPFAKEAVKRAEEYLTNNTNVRTIKVGGVIYRDQADGRYVTEILPMTSPKDRKVEWFFKGGDYGIKSSPSDRTDFNALYKGLETALDSKRMGYSTNNSNLMFVIGDAGNDPNGTSGLSEDQIVSKCVANRIQMSSFLVRNINTPASAQFRKQMRKIVMKNMESQYRKIVNDLKYSYNEVGNHEGYDFKPDISAQSSYFIGGFRNALSGQDMDQAKLYELMKSASDRFEEAAAKVQDRVVNASEIASGETTNTNLNSADLSIAQNLLIEILGREAYNALKETKYIMAFTGKVPQKNAGGLDYWKPVIYISHDELLNLMDQLGPVMEATKDEDSSKSREDYVNAMKGLVKSMLPGVTDQQMGKMDNTEIMHQILGLNVKSKSLEKYRLIDIQNERQVSPEAFSGLVSDFAEKYRKLEDIQGNKQYPFRNKRNGVDFYWIPVEDLP